MRYEIPERFQELWQTALPFQDKRNDRGHAFVVTAYAVRTCEIEKCELSVVVPAAILHDIGWSEVSEMDRMSVFTYGASDDERLRVRNEHQVAGVKLAENILRQVGYESKYMPEILEIISQHDTRVGFIGKNEGAMRDADKLWRYDEFGFLSDYLNGTGTILDHIEDQERNINVENFFCFDSSKKLVLNQIQVLRTKYL